MLFLGFSAGLPLLLIFSTLSLWLREAGVERSAVTYFSWAALGYSFKFVWAPLVDKLPIPFLHQWLGKRRSWLLVSQGLVITAMIWMAMNDPSTQNGLYYMAFAAVMLGFSSATQDIVIDAYRREDLADEELGLGSSMYVYGYRLGMLMASGGGLILADHMSFSAVYFLMSLCMLPGILTTLLTPEPKVAAGTPQTMNKSAKASISG